MIASSLLQSQNIQELMCKMELRGIVAYPLKEKSLGNTNTDWQIPKTLIAVFGLNVI